MPALPKPLLPVLVVGGLALAWYLGRVNATQAASAPASLEAHSKSEQDGTHRLEQLLEGMDARLRNLESDRHPTETPQPTAATKPSISPEDDPRPDPAASIAESQARKAELDDRLKEERPDPAWSRDFESKTSSNFQNRFPKSRVLESQCATSLCRFELGHDDQIASADFMDDFWRSLPEYAEAHYYPSGDAKTGFHTTVYVVRRGYD